ncbi:MAG: hypothetical protein QXW47_11815 [Candidatus Jordarchaeales archaeon]|nr:VapB-type antitoxin [Candidatus Jordarchaeia archaeon]
MAVVSVDERGRLTLPRNFGVRSTKAVVIPAGSFIVVIPLPGKPSEHAEGWLSTEKSARELKDEAERAAMMDARGRAERRSSAV